MATAKKKTAQAATKQPAASNPAAKSDGPVKAPENQAPEATTTQPADESKERGPATDGTSSGEVKLEVSTRLERRIRAGVVVTKEPKIVEVSDEAAELLAADPQIKVKRA